jgi:hypothetical protein
MEGTAHIWLNESTHLKRPPHYSKSDVPGSDMVEEVMVKT